MGLEKAMKAIRVSEGDVISKWPLFGHTVGISMWGKGRMEPYHKRKHTI
jgi:hypothetical protein